MTILEGIVNFTKTDFLSLSDFNCHIYAKDPQGKYLFINESLMKDTGFSKMDDMLGLTDFDLSFLPKNEVLNLRKNDEKILATKQACVFIEPLTLCNGKKIIAISQKAPLRSKTKKNLGVSGMSFIMDREKFYSFSLRLEKDFYIEQIESPEKSISSNEKINNTSLTKREKECLYYLVRGKYAREIATILNISRRTTEHHIASIKMKLNVNSKSELIEKVIDDYM